MANETDNSRAVTITVDGQERVFDIDNPDLPKWVDKNDLTAGGFPYDKKMDRDDYEEQLEALQIELVELQTHMQETGERMIVVFEGRDSAGKGGTIKRLTAYLNPRTTRVVALPKPSDRERGEWYYQRYVSHFPTDGELVVFDRSWYNRGGVEPVMGFCTQTQHQRFLEETPDFERIITGEGIHFFKFWLNIGRETQLKRFHDRRHSALKHWKLSGIDVVGMTKWDDYTVARDTMMKATHTTHAPWTVVRYNDKRRGRIEVLRHILSAVNYKGKSTDVIGKPDPKIIGSGPAMLDG
ncbi:MAG: polyphosphate kinase 2 [Ahrensia sp.]